jgi:hypothetical protein
MWCSNTLWGLVDAILLSPVHLVRLDGHKVRSALQSMDRVLWERKSNSNIKLRKSWEGFCVLLEPWADFRVLIISPHRLNILRSLFLNIFEGPDHVNMFHTEWRSPYSSHFSSERPFSTPSWEDGSQKFSAAEKGGVLSHNIFGTLSRHVYYIMDRTKRVRQ